MKREELLYKMPDKDHVWKDKHIGTIKNSIGLSLDTKKGDSLNNLLIKTYVLEDLKKKAVLFNEHGAKVLVVYDIDAVIPVEQIEDILTIPIAPQL